ncbi:MAG: hypothetical protein WAQ07_03350 [Candidatus Omnitrophota bacterium]
MNIGILDFDGSLTSQKRLLSKYSPKVIDLKSFSSSARLWMNKDTAGVIQGCIRELNGGINFLGSGDFHHISSLFTDLIDEPAALIIFDFHPDWDILPPSIGCGSWVTRSLKNKNIAKCILIGVSSSDIQFPSIQSGNLKLLEDNRAEIYPYKSKPSSVFLKRVPPNKSIKLKRGVISTKIFWHELAKEDLSSFFLSLILSLPTKKAYISIDKDCLKDDYALTNWESGFLSLDELLTMIKLIKDNLDIAGVDITGDYSKPTYRSFLKSIASCLDHPSDIKADSLQEERIRELNEDTNLKLLSVLNP